MSIVFTDFIDVLVYALTNLPVALMQGLILMFTAAFFVLDETDTITGMNALGTIAVVLIGWRFLKGLIPTVLGVLSLMARRRKSRASRVRG